jgi:hypothetical protein
MRGLFIFKLYLKINQEARLWGLLKKSLELNKKIMYFLYIIFLQYLLPVLVNEYQCFDNLYQFVQYFE